MCSCFKKYDSLFDDVINYFDFDSAFSFENYLFNKFGEEKLSYSIFQLWEPSGKIFKNETIDIFTSFKNLLTKSHSILRTRSFFEKRWILNSVRFSLLCSSSVSLKEKGTSDIIICASGPSLQTALPFIKEKQNCYIIALSSAINPLLENKIIPDLCLSTDGGFWAKTHLTTLKKITDKTIFALAVEGNSFSKFIQSSTILPLVYSDGIESKIFGNTKITSFPALRCGTVSGTALDLALKISTGRIYFCGLDLSLSKGFQHTQTNLIELSNSLIDNKLQQKEKRISIQSFSNQKESLKIYEDWFKNFDTGNKSVFRVTDSPQNSLGKISDISSKDFSSVNHSGTKPVFTKNENTALDIRCKNIKNFITSYSDNKSWLYNCFPADYLNYMHNCDENQRESILEKINNQNKALLIKIDRLCRQFTGKL